MTHWEFRDRSEQSKRGNLATTHGNLPEAQRLFGESLRIAQRLAESDPANVMWQQDVQASRRLVAQVRARLLSK